MSLIYSENFSSYADNLDIDPNVPNWVHDIQTGAPGQSFKVSSGNLPPSTKCGRIVPFSGEWNHVTYNVVFAQPYFELRGRYGAFTGFFELFVHQQAPTIFPSGYAIKLDGTNWTIGIDNGPGVGFIALATGTVSCNILNVKVRIIMNGTVMTIWVNDVPVPGGTYDFSLIGNPYPSGRFGMTILSNDGEITDLEVYDAPVVSNAALLDVRRRR